MGNDCSCGRHEDPTFTIHIENAHKHKKKELEIIKETVLERESDTFVELPKSNRSKPEEDAPTAESPEHIKEKTPTPASIVLDLATDIESPEGVEKIKSLASKKFAVYDEDKDDKLNYREFRNAYKAMEGKPDLTHEEVFRAFLSFDLDEDGYISLKEFQDMITASIKFYDQQNKEMQNGGKGKKF